MNLYPEGVEIEHRQAALCLIPFEAAFLITEITDPHSGAVLHRPPGGGIEPGETPEEAVRRELYEELEVTLGELQLLGSLDHVWFWKGREVHERAWIFVAEASDDSRLNRGETPQGREADGASYRTVWRRLDAAGEGLPALCPSRLCELL